jgi:hypothetical protein
MINAPRVDSLLPSIIAIVTSAFSGSSIFLDTTDLGEAVKAFVALLSVTAFAADYMPRPDQGSPFLASCASAKCEQRLGRAC